MGSHKGIGGLQLYVPSPMRFKKRPSAFNICIGKKMKGTPGPTAGGRYDKGFQKRFVAAAVSCGAKVSAATKRKWGV